MGRWCIATRPRRPHERGAGVSRWIETEVRIDAPLARVWEILCDTAAYGVWNPFLRRIEGELRPGARLHVEMELPGFGRRRFRPTVLALLDARELRWLGRLWVPGLLDGEHRFRLEACEGGGVRLLQDEHFQGVLVLPLWRRLAPSLEAGFERMNQALKTRAEADAQARP